MPSSTPPLDLLRELREVFVADAKAFRSKEAGAWTTLEKHAIAGKAAACEHAVKRIDATLRDWA